MISSKVTQKGQVTIPKKIRSTLNLRANDKVIFIRRGDDVVLKPVRDILTLRGAIKVDKVQDLADIRERVHQAIGEHNARE